MTRMRLRGPGNVRPGLFDGSARPRGGRPEVKDVTLVKGDELMYEVRIIGKGTRNVR